MVFSFSSVENAMRVQSKNKSPWKWDTQIWSGSEKVIFLSLTCDKFERVRSVDGCGKSCQSVKEVFDGSFSTSSCTHGTLVMRPLFLLIRVRRLRLPSHSFIDAGGGAETTGLFVCESRSRAPRECVCEYKREEWMGADCVCSGSKI